MIIRQATEADLYSIKNIWRISFGDSDKFIEFHFNYADDLSDTFLVENNKEVIAMVSVLPAELSLDKKYEVGYIYAAATMPEFRGRGIMGRLLTYCENHAIKEDYVALALVPSSLSLFDFYSMHGYEKTFYHNNISKKYEQINNIQGPDVIKRCGIKEYIKSRNSIKNRYAFLRLNAFYDELSLLELEFSGYQTYNINSNAYAIIKRESDTIKIHELVCEHGEEKAIIELLISHFNDKQVSYRAPTDVDIGGDVESKPFAMMKWLKSRPNSNLAWYTNNLLD
ncbi:MAG: GNAT family N-acetyltransferase [Clostridiales bacterium]|nr:GNAT family N-acetyltransferase [Clostridiales bacterium]